MRHVELAKTWSKVVTAMHKNVLFLVHAEIQILLNRLSLSFLGHCGPAKILGLGYMEKWELWIKPTLNSDVDKH